MIITLEMLKAEKPGHVPFPNLVLSRQARAVGVKGNDGDDKAECSSRESESVNVQV